MTRYITQSMFIIISNKTSSERWKQTYRVFQYSYSDGHDVCVHWHVISSSWVTTGTCGERGSEFIRPNIYSMITSFSDDQKLNEVNLRAPNTYLEISRHSAHHYLTAFNQNAAGCLLIQAPINKILRKALNCSFLWSKAHRKLPLVEKKGNIQHNRTDLHVYFKMFTEPRMCKWIVYLQGLTATSDAKSGLLVKLMWLCYFRAMLQRVHIPSEKAITGS